MTATATSSVYGNDDYLIDLNGDGNDKENGLKHGYNGNERQDISTCANYRTF